ncbi:iron ABC transporter ATP-binding protein [Agromyces intestinalis]|uniref:Iron ABC transporter ATP-binding protein n=1 Tax=Agromyces intestinalis TaxID=2592652 RepID=A0A5C1YBR1_9MICO|nr:iron ABC transporter ATP-binding protein [Agromyces intestinalis]QEO13451.1 iron ABC transporter ATP-binding protein [Agromyces intestinalis]
MLRSLRRPLRPLLVAAAVAGAAALLAACAPGSPLPTGGTTPATEHPTESAPSTGEPTPGETFAPEEPSPPFAIACDALLTPEQVYAFNPNVGAAPEYEPASANVLAVVDAGGTACGWLNQTSGEVIEIAVATPADAALAAAASSAASRLQAVPTYGTPPAVEGYFGRAGQAGSAQVFSGRYWVVVESVALFEPGDAAGLVGSVLGNLPAS